LVQALSCYGFASKPKYYAYFWCKWEFCTKSPSVTRRRSSAPQVDSALKVHNLSPLDIKPAIVYRAAGLGRRYFHSSPPPPFSDACYPQMVAAASTPYITNKPPPFFLSLILLMAAGACFIRATIVTSLCQDAAIGRRDKIQRIKGKGHNSRGTVST
jgi:hypothetical protein